MFSLKMKSLVGFVFVLVIKSCLVHVRCGIIEDWVSNCTVPSNMTFSIEGPDLKKIAIILVDKGGNRIRYPYGTEARLLKHRDMDLKRKTIMISSGFLDSPYFFFTGILAGEYRKLNYNVIAVDAHYYYTVPYPISARYVNVIGRRIAEMLVNMAQHGFNIKTLEIIGLSLGGQTMGFVGKEFQRLTGVKLPRLTALDAAAPCFSDVAENRLDKSDAEFVDVVATNIDILGISEPVGHVNFYVNGGMNQPGDMWWFPCMNLCSHVRSLFMWMSAMNHLDQEAFIAIQCDNAEQARNHSCFDRRPQITNTFGLNVDKNVQGVFYLVTDYTYPYFLGKDGLTNKYKYNRNKMGSIDIQDAMKLWTRRANLNRNYQK